MTILIFLFLIIAMTTPYRPGVLGCGLTGFIPNKKNSANMDWIKLILTYNAERGTDSCGLFMNNSSRKGVKTESDVKDFLARNPVIQDPKCKNKVIIGHTRKATLGAHNEENAHPFTYEHEGRTIVLAHNGSISNSFDFSKEFDVPDLYKLDVDSQRLAMTLLVTGDYDVLKYYKGFAALIWTYLEEPNVVYLFKGGSKTVRNGVVVEERPLFFIEANEGIYVSSMREPLDACCNQELTVYTPNINVVYRIENNQCEAIVKIEREESNLFTQPAAQTSTVSQAPTLTTTQDFGGTTTDKLSRSVNVPNTPKIYDEVASDQFQPSVAAVGDRIYFLAGRYYAIPHQKSSVFNREHDTFTPDEEDTYEFLLHGEYAINCTNTMRNTNNYYVTTGNNNSRIAKEFFYEGVLIETSKVERFKTRVMNRIPNMNVFEKIRQLSSFSKHPITFAHKDFMKINNEDIKFYWNGKVVAFEVSVRPYMSNRRYHISKDGYLYKVCSIPSDPIFSIDVINKQENVSRNLNFSFKHSLEEEVITVSETTDNESDLKVTIIPNTLGNKPLWRYKCSDKVEEDSYTEEFLHGLDPNQWYFLGNTSVAMSGEEILINAIKIMINESLSSYDERSDTEQCLLDEYDRYVSERVKFLYSEGIDSDAGLQTYLENSFKSVDFNDTYLKRAVVKLYKEDEEYEINTGDNFTSNGIIV